MSAIMALNPPTTGKRLAVPTDAIWRLSVDQYHTMIDAGILTDDAPVGLLEGWLITKMSKKPSYRIGTRLIRQASVYCAWPETAFLAKCEDRACQGTIEKKAQF